MKPPLEEVLREFDAVQDGTHEVLKEKYAKVPAGRIYADMSNKVLREFDRLMIEVRYGEGEFDDAEVSAEALAQATEGAAAYMILKVLMATTDAADGYDAVQLAGDMLSNVSGILRERVASNFSMNSKKGRIIQ